MPLKVNSDKQKQAIQDLKIFSESIDENLGLYNKSRDLQIFLEGQPKNNQSSSQILKQNWRRINNQRRQVYAKSYDSKNKSLKPETHKTISKFGIFIKPSDYFSQKTQTDKMYVSGFHIGPHLEFSQQYTNPQTSSYRKKMMNNSITKNAEYFTSNLIKVGSGHSKILGSHRVINTARDDKCRIRTRQHQK